MSLENAIQNLAEAVAANTAAVEANTAAALGHEPEAPAPKAAAAKPAAKAAAPAAKPAAKKPAPKAAPEPEDDGGFGGDDDNGETDEKTLDDVKVALQRLSKQDGKDAAMELLKKYGVSNINKLDEGDFGPLVEEAESMLA